MEGAGAAEANTALTASEMSNFNMTVSLVMVIALSKILCSPYKEFSNS